MVWVRRWREPPSPDTKSLLRAGLFRYCHDWDCHGGAVYLHEHMVNDYVYCWQQGLSDGEWDAASCDMGVSRWFNYYANGAYWSAVNAPHIDGIYYDGVNFDRQSFRRIRKLLDAGSPNPLIDIHTGEVSDEPSSVRYIGTFFFFFFFSVSRVRIAFPSCERVCVKYLHSLEREAVGKLP
jgi:hypothetical protein